MKYKIFVSGAQKELKVGKTYPPKVNQLNLSIWVRCGTAISTSEYLAKSMDL